MTDASADQYSDFIDDLDAYSDEKSTWEKDRQKAISGAETQLKLLIDDFRPSLQGSVFTRWYILLGLNAGMFLIIVWLLKRKDPK